MKTFLKVIVIILLTIILLLGGFIIYLTSHEYKPDDTQNIAVENANKAIQFDKNDISILSFNTGYACLGNGAESYIDGGKINKGTDKDTMGKNAKELLSIIKSTNADFTLLQEVDQKSFRSYDFNQVNYYINNMNQSGSFALNYSCPFVPYPVPPIGRVNSGILSLSPYSANNTYRVSLPCPFSWPMKVANLKRCLLVNNYPIANSDKELVIINLHLEAYDDGAEGRIKQTQMMIDLLEKEYQKGNYVIAGGDFNQTFTGGLEKYPIMSDEFWEPNVLDDSMLPEGWHFVTDLDTPTCRLLNRPYDATNTDNQYYVIDGFIVSPNVEIKSVKTLDYNFKESDHNPILLNAKLK